MRLKEIAQVTIGILVNREKDDNAEKVYKLFSLKNYEEKQEYEEIRTDKDISSRISREGDLLFRLIYPNKIIYVDKEIANLVIPSQLCIIRANQDIIDPIFLKWYLESDEAKKQIIENVTGSIIKTMSVSALKSLNIPDVNKTKQAHIKKLIELWEKEKEISQKLIDNKEKLYNSYINDILKNQEDK